MFRPRFSAFRIVTPGLAILMVFPLASLAGEAAVDNVAAGNAGAGWHSATSSAASQREVTHLSQPTASPTSPQWRLPNGATGPVEPNPLRQNNTTASARREPRAFQPSMNAAPLAARHAASSAMASGVQKHTPSAAIGQASAATPQRATPALANGIPRSRHTVAQPSARRFTPQAHAQQSYSSKVWDAVQVAFQGPDQWTGEAENLPLPRQGGQRTMQETPEAHAMPYGPSSGPDGFGEYGEGPFTPYGAPGPYFDDGMAACGCGDAGCSCEPGCACGAGCENGQCTVACGDDICCAGRGDPESCHTIRVSIPKWQELMVFGGVQGFKGPYDQTRDSGNFGFHEGFNVGFKVPFTELGYQIGYRATHSQLNGDKDTNIADPHTQQFVTAGMFQRVKDGVQFGIAWDMLRDERFGAVDFHQLRTELSFIDHGCHEFGFAGAFHLNDHERFVVNGNGQSNMFQASDQYLLFYRIHGARGGEGRFYAGFNDDSDGIVGADLLLPVQDRWSLATGFTYLIPQESAGQEGAAHEAWNIGLALVWHWDCRARKCHSSCYRPMFNVADNGYLIVDERLGAPGD